MDLELRHLRLIAALAETAHMTRAAHQLHLTQSALSHQLRDIEDRLGRRLFDRGPRTMRPTAAGRRLLETAARVLEEIERAEKEVRAQPEARTVLRVSTECYTCYHWLPGLLKEFRRKHPRVDVQIVAEATRRPLPRLLEGQLDLAIVVDRPRNARITYRPLFIDELVAVLPPAHRLLRRPYLVAQDFADEHLLVYDAPRSDLTIFVDVLDPAGVSPREVSAMQLTEAIVELVKAGMGIGIMARWAALPHLQAGTVAARPLTARGLRRHWQAAFLKKKDVPAHVLDFIEIMARRSVPAVFAQARRTTGAARRRTA
jgi:LysR family transcriptional regulator, regulator for metE and metH